MADTEMNTDLSHIVPRAPKLNESLLIDNPVVMKLLMNFRKCPRCLSLIFDPLTYLYPLSYSMPSWE